MHQLRNAVLRQDTGQLLVLSSSETHDLLAKLHTLLKQQRAAIEERYPKEHQHAARLSYPKGALEAADTQALFAALVAGSFKELETKRPNGLRFGLTSMGAPTIQDGRASVATESGETVKFVLEDEQWKTTVFQRSVESNLNSAQLNQQTLEENLKVIGEINRRAAAKKKPVKAEASASP